MFMLYFDFQTDNEIEDKLKSIKFLGPFERYKLVRPYLEEQEKKEEAKRLKEAEERSKNSENPQEQIIERTDEDRIETVSGLYLIMKRVFILFSTVNLYPFGNEGFVETIITICEKK